MGKDLSAAQVGTQRKSHVNEPKTKVFTGMTKFPMSYKMANTVRYGHITPFYYQHSRGDDIVPLYSEHDLRTYTLQSPMMSDLNMNKSYFLVDMESIYPRNWNLMLVNPSKGSDVPQDTRLVSRDFLSYMKRLLNEIRNRDYEDDPDALSDFINFVFLLESIFSAGSLFSEFDIHLCDFLEVRAPVEGDPVYLDFDHWFDNYFASNISIIKSFSIGNTIYDVRNVSNSYFDQDEETWIVSPRRAIEIFRDNVFEIVNYDNQNVQILTQTLGYLKFRETSTNGGDIDLEDYPINLEIIAGYQLGCAQFFTDSHVDYIYNSRLYRDALESLIYSIRSSTGDFDFRNLYFIYNSTHRLYDVLSGHVFDIVLNSLFDNTISTYAYKFLKLLFNHQSSLRYGDYFVTGRPNPLGVGDVSVDTSQASVSVIDITRRIQYQRFLNSVNLSSQKIGEYARNVLGLDDASDVSYDIPSFLGHKSLPIRGMEVENTGERQTDPNSVTTILRSENNVHAFEVRTKRPCIIYGVYSFDVARIYSKTFDRMHMHEDRYDDFIPQLQYVGDQPIFRRELNALSDSDSTFAYAVRYMEYKIRHHYAAGGAITSLPSWFMITDGIEGDKLYAPYHITPDFIRSKPSEFDRFYSRLSGYSLGTYFHFIVLTTNHQTLTRMMEYAPEPLK